MTISANSFGRTFKSERAAANYAASVQGTYNSVFNSGWVYEMIIFVAPHEGGWSAFVVAQ